MRVTFVLALFAVGFGLLAGTRSILKAAQDPAKSPRARLHVAATPPRVMFSTAENRDDYPRFLKTQQSLIRSNLVLGAALRDPQIARLPSIKDRTDPLSWLQQNLEVKNLTDSEILEISMAPGCGASGADQAAIINTVKRVYMDQVVSVDVKRRAERFDHLKKIKASYNELLNRKREHLRKRSESAGSGDSLGGLEKDVLPRLYHDLRTRRVQLRLEQSETETLLARRKKVEGATTDPARHEIARLEDRLAVLTAGRKVIDEELERLTQEMRRTVGRELDLAAQKEDFAQMEDASRRVGAEIEALSVELEAPPRIRTIDDAVAP